MANNEVAMARERMVREQIERRGVRDARVLDALRAVDRAVFVPSSQQAQAYADHPLPLESGQTISQPYMVAAMTEALELTAASRVLEIGTGSGYQCAILAELAAEVYSVERVAALHATAAPLLARYDNVHLRVGDGFEGWPEAAPFDAIIVTCASREAAPAWLDQLAPGGRLVAPLGPSEAQQLTRLRRGAEDVETEPLMAVRFVPLR